MKDGRIELDSDFGKEIGFTRDRFSGWLWKQGDRVILSLINSALFGQGYLTALVEAIEGRGLRVAVPTPMPLMRMWLEKRNFVPHVEEDPFVNQVEVWERSVAWTGIDRQPKASEIWQHIKGEYHRYEIMGVSNSVYVGGFVDEAIAYDVETQEQLEVYWHNHGITVLRGGRAIADSYVIYKKPSDKIWARELTNFVGMKDGRYRFEKMERPLDGTTKCLSANRANT